MNFAMLDAFLCKHHIFKYFARMLNSRDIKIANISENKILANNSESTVFDNQKMLKTRGCLFKNKVGLNVKTYTGPVHNTKIRLLTSY